MSDNMPVGNQPNQPEFKQKALDANFKFIFSRKQCIILVNALRPIQLPVGDLRSKVLRDILEEVELLAISSIKPTDYESLTAPLKEVKTS